MNLGIPLDETIGDVSFPAIAPASKREAKLKTPPVSHIPTCDEREREREFFPTGNWGSLSYGGLPVGCACNVKKCSNVQNNAPK